MEQPTRLPLALFLLLCGIFLISISGHTYSSDEETMVAVTRGLITAGDVAVAGGDAPVSALRRGRDDQTYSPYGVLPSLLALPLYGLGMLIGGGSATPATDYAARFLIGVLNAPITAGTAALLAAWSLRLGARPRWAAALALLYGLCTFAWPYARTFFSEPLAGLLMMVAAERAEAAKCKMQNAKAWEEPSSEYGDVGQWIDKAQKDLALSGLASGLLLTTRIAAGVTLPVIALYMLWVAALCYRPGILRSIGHFAFGLIPGLALLAWYNIARFGTPLASGYATEQGQFTTPLAVGLYGLLLSPGKSVLLFAPPLILALPGARALWRRGRADLVLLCAGLFLSHLLLYALWDVWQGGGVWGPRFLLPVVAVGMLPAAALGGPREAHPHVKVRLGLRACVGALAILGFLGNLGGALFNFSTYVNSTAEAARVYSLIGSPLIGHWRALAGRWGNYLAPPPTCALGDGWYASESAAGASLPRRSGASGELRCRVPTGSHLSFTLDDRRPPEAPPSYLRLTLNGRDIGPTRVGQRRIYRLVLPASALLEIRATPWNPHAIGFSSRDDQLGPVLADLGGASPAGAVIAVVDTAVAPLPADPRARWAWYYDPPNQHFADLWLWYLPRSELAGPRAWLLAGLLLLVGTASIAGGISALRPMRPRAARLHRP